MLLQASDDLEQIRGGWIALEADHPMQQVSTGPAQLNFAASAASR
jgi:hypothetical protein